MNPEKNSSTPPPVPSSQADSRAITAVTADEATPAARRREIDGPAGPEPTRFGDWERKGRCIDF
ncbi:MAG TPA: DUF1674 domain-containing protein [Steroidobacteraceae bacterium]|nr:DUF1674 domain-containing protein [Steroidobacteraceae bacterium]